MKSELTEEELIYGKDLCENLKEYTWNKNFLLHKQKFKLLL